MSKEHAKIEMDLAFGSGKPYGSSRSLVRRIASSLPIKPCPRVRFQLYPYTEEAGVLIRAKRQTNPVASLADVAWIEGDEEDDEGYFGRSSRPGVPPGFMFRAQQPRPQRKPVSRRRSLPTLHEDAPDPRGPTAANDEAIQKISALETELAKLRAQIAQIVLAQERTAQSAVVAGVPPPSGSVPPPPPPPPPPPLPAPALQRTFSAIELIKERRGKKKDEQTPVYSKPADIPSMLDILKDIDKVKLRSVKSRLENVEGKTKSNEPADPAGLIAEALKRKFAHRFRQNSGQEGSDREDVKVADPEDKPQSEAPLFGQHMLKPTGRKKLL
ncbi:mitochondrial fission regulator 1 isoform X1 [Poecilia latipinna]|uniref:mitochondrial fission regulator 1 isoform X1 n=1 Tax=Poecilia latipinna TaxID=48699 RepID=UPI00072EC314|nr:PREDICTED: mitochondrial fission regulator 1 isoform X1 [Poecilia latipinna]XP_014871136.1 PREDICTED: mitochondrial fission regulator 1 isoform X1 [Poecilia latipinna]